MQGLGSEHQVHERRAFDDALAFLAGHAATHTDNKSGRCCFSSRQRPSWENTFSWAFSRTEQVLSRITSASSARSVNSIPWDALSTSAILAESYSFIWQAKVL